MIKLEILLADSRSFQPEQLAAQKLSTSCAERLARIAHPDRRHQFLLGRWLLANATDYPASEIEESIAGYPVIASQPEIHASLSHSAHYVGIVVSKSFRCGLDIESPARARDWKALAARAFHPDEQVWLAEAPEALAERFHKIWTLREAAYKAGLRAEVIEGPPALNITSGLAANGLFWHYENIMDCHISVVAPCPFSANIRSITPDEKSHEAAR